MRHFKPVRYIPEGATEKKFDDVSAVVYVYTGKTGMPVGIAYGGRRNTPDWHFRYPTMEKLEEKIESWVNGLRQHAEYIKERREKNKNNPSSHALGALNLKADLERNFPGVKFSVRSETFSMGDAIRVHWTDGPSARAVELITDRYQEGNFNGMEDIYEYNHNRDASRGGAKYVTCSRETTKPEIEENNRYTRSGLSLVHSA